MISDEIGKDEVRVLPPGMEKCPYCADRHTEKEPHNRNSVYYQMRFFRKHGHMPTWIDALEHCSEMTRAYWTGEMIRKGVRLEEITTDGK